MFQLIFQEVLQMIFAGFRAIKSRMAEEAATVLAMCGWDAFVKNKIKDGYGVYFPKKQRC